MIWTATIFEEPALCFLLLLKKISGVQITDKEQVNPSTCVFESFKATFPLLPKFTLTVLLMLGEM